MPLGLVAASQFDLELARFQEIEIKHGRGNKSSTPEVIRELVASEAICHADVNELSETFNVSKSSISAYKNGATSTATYHEPDKGLALANDKVRGNIVGKAQDKLTRALDSINFTDDIKPQIASAIARDMSSIVKNLNPNPDILVQNNQVLVYKPRMKEEDSYEIINVSDE